MDFKIVPKEYRPIPFWSLNDKLTSDETANQVKMMDKAGIGGFIMHARGGLETDYMGEEWFENITVAKDEAKKSGMRVWAYDENGWPSGGANGKVYELGLDFHQKYLRMEDEPNHPETQICKCGNHWFYYEVNNLYIDTLDKKVVKKFVEYAYEPYYTKYSNDIEAFFTDEPNISRNGIPWSFVLEKEYKKRYNEDLLIHLEELFDSVGDYKKTRVKFWKMITDLFSQSYFKQIYDWCDERGCKFTGHLLSEDSINAQLTVNGACMPHYEYFHIPAIDWLFRECNKSLTVYQVVSAAQQLGKKEILTESFAACGHGISFAELKGIYEYQLVRGVNRLCPHLQGYSMRGLRKRDWPPALYYQQPWWNEYDKFVEMLSRESMILSEGEIKADVLVLHPQTTAWAAYGDKSGAEVIARIQEELCVLIGELEKKHISFHLGDETLIERHGRVEGGKFILGQQEYKYVITAGCDVFFENTEKLLKEFKAGGGKIVSVYDLPENNVVDRDDITYTIRYYNNFKIHYFVNSSEKRKQAKINVQGRQIDITNGETLAFSGVHDFEPWGSLMIIEDGSENIYKTTEKHYVKPEGKFRIEGSVLNAITLDKCDYYFDGVLQEKDGFVISICERINKLKRKVTLQQDYHINIKDKPETLYLVCENPDKTKIKVNGAVIDKTECGYYCDKSFKKIDIKKYIIQGQNVISFDRDVVQSCEFYESYKKAMKYETEKNKLKYNAEIESVYLLGSFAVETKGEWENLRRKAIRYKGDFALVKLPEYIELKDMEKQGFPFFCGEISLSGRINATGDNPVLKLEINGINVVKVEIDGKAETIFTDDELPLWKKGELDVKFTLINNLRNLLGPHHFRFGECHHVSPSTFHKEKCLWNKDGEDKWWNDDYCFIRTGI